MSKNVNTFIGKNNSNVVKVVSLENDSKWLGLEKIGRDNFENLLQL